MRHVEDKCNGTWGPLRCPGSRSAWQDSPLLAPGSSRLPSRFFVRLGLFANAMTPAKGGRLGRDHSTREAERFSTEWQANTLTRQRYKAIMALENHASVHCTQAYRCVSLVSVLSHQQRDHKESLARVWLNSDQHRQHIWPKSANLGRSWSDAGLHRPQNGQSMPTSAKLGPNCARNGKTWPGSDRWW